MKRQLREVAWVVAGQAGTALGTLIGVRILTQFLSPDDYGSVTLAMGLSVLATNLVAAPITQAAVHFYPGVVASGSASELLAAVLRGYRAMTPWILSAVVVGGCVYLFWQHGSPALFVVLVLLFASDCWRSANLSLLGAARRQQRYGSWMASDAWSRPLAASLIVALVGGSPELVLTSYLIISVCLNILFSRGLWPRDAQATPAAARARELDQRMWAYALPLIPLGVISWVSTLGDRYFIGGLLGVADAGIYAAVHGLSNSPFMILNTMAELGLRPIYQTAVTQGDTARSRRILTIWLAVVISAAALGLSLFAIGHEWLARIFVGTQFRSGSSLMPWIASGYAIRATSYVFERVCYAYGATRRVLLIQLCAVIATFALTPLAVITLGLKGAAMAVPACFSVQLVAAMFFARRAVLEARARGDVGPVMYGIQTR
jgi:O-antigen/teichoic acid export membrane protein